MSPRHDPAPTMVPCFRCAGTGWVERVSGRRKLGFEERLRRSMRGPYECWPWFGAQDKGYGRTDWKGKLTTAHRASWEYHNGPVPKGLHLDHLCRNRACVNPAHLEPVTPAENSRRSPLTLGSINRVKTHCNRGHAFTAENTIVQKGRWRACRECRRINERARYRSRRKGE